MSIGESKCKVARDSSYFRFPGRGQRNTPVVDVRGIVEIVALLPGPHCLCLFVCLLVCLSVCLVCLSACLLDSLSAGRFYRVCRARPLQHLEMLHKHAYTTHRSCFIACEFPPWRPEGPPRPEGPADPWRPEGPPVGPKGRPDPARRAGRPVGPCGPQPIIACE